MSFKPWQALLVSFSVAGQLLFSPQWSLAAVAPGSESGGWTIQSEIVLDRYPPGIAVDSDSLWIPQAKMLLRVELGSGRTTAQIPLDCRPRRVTAVAGAVLVVCEANKVFVIDPLTEEVAHFLRVKGEVSALTHGDGFIWILHPLGKVSRLDPEKLEDVHTLKIAGKGLSVNQNGLAYFNDTLWILNSKKGNLIGVNPISGEVTYPSIDLVKGAVRIVAGSACLWIVNALESRASCFDPGSAEITASIPVGKTPIDAVFFEDALWTVNAQGRSLTRIELGTHTATTVPLSTQSRPVSVVAAKGALWLSTIDDHRVLKVGPAGGEETAADDQLRSAVGPQCMSGPDYKREMLDKECDSVQAIENSPAGRLTAMAATRDSGWVFAGTTDSAAAALFLICTESSGRILWNKRFARGSEARAVDVVTLDGGDYVVAADIRVDKESSWETLLARFDADGELVWEKQYPAAAASRLVSQIVAWPAGGLAMAGSNMSNAPSLHRHASVSRIGPGGEVVWESELTEIEGIDRLALSDREIAAVGRPQGQSSLRLIRMDFAGKSLGSTRAASENIQATDLISMADGGWAVVGDPRVWAGRGHLLRLDDQGEISWCRYLGSGDAYSWGWRLLPLADGSLLAVGTPRYYVSLVGLKGFLNLARLSKDGQLIEEQLYKGFATHEVLGLFPWPDIGYVLLSAGDWRGPIGHQRVRAYERPKRRYSGALRKTRRIRLNPQGQVEELRP